MGNVSTEIKDLPGALTAAGTRARKHEPVCIEIPVQVRSIEGLPVPGSSEIPKAFHEDTRTLIVFQQGGVLRMATKVTRGQMLSVTHTMSGQVTRCRVVNVRSSGPAEEYVEVEFTERAIGFWGMHFPSEPLPEQAEIAGEKAWAERISVDDAARAETEAAIALRRQTAQAQAEKLDADKKAKEKADIQCAAEEKAAGERAEAARLAEQVAAERAAAERIAAERETQRRADAARRAAEREEELAEQQRLAEMREASEKMAAERAEAERLAAERAASEIAVKAREREQQQEAERAAKEKAAADARAAAEQLAAEQAEAARIARERAAEELAAKARERAQQLEAEKAAREKAQADARAAREQKQKEAEETRAILAKLEVERHASEIAAANRAVHEKAESQRVATEKAADTMLGYGMSAAGLPSRSQEKAASREKAAKDKSEAMHKVVEAAAAEKAAKLSAADAEKALLAEKVEKARSEKEHKEIVARLETERLRNEKSAAAKIQKNEKRAAATVRAATRGSERSSAAVANTLFGSAEAITVAEPPEADTNEHAAVAEDAGEAHAQARPRNNTAVFGTLGAEIAHDRQELHAHSKSRSSVVLGIAASALIVVGGGAWWMLLGPGAVARDKAPSELAASHAQVSSSPDYSATSAASAPAPYAAGSVANPAAPSQPVPDASSPADRNAANRNSASTMSPYGAAETNNFAAANPRANNSSADVASARDSRAIKTTSRIKDAPKAAAKAASVLAESPAASLENKSAAEPARKIVARPALDATLRAPVQRDSLAPSAGAAIPLPEIRSAAPMPNSAMSNSENSILGDRANAANGVAPPPPMGGKVQQGRLLKSVPPQYPDLARQRHLEGDVVVRASVDAAGKVVQVTALDGPDLLRAAAIASVKQWKYSPALLNGQPVSMQVQITVKFRSNR